MVTATEHEFEHHFQRSSQLGTIQIADGVIARIAALAANEVEGVSLGGRFQLADLLGRNEGVKGVKVDYIENDRCSITLDVQMAYKTSMTELAAKLQRKVKEVVEAMTGRPVDAVNVVIVGLSPPSSDEEK